jgi:TonB family protein
VKTVSITALRNPISRSFLLHFALFLVAFYYLAHSPKTIAPEEPITLEIVEAPTAKAKRIENVTVRKQIVQKSEGQEVKEAKKDSYLSDKTRTVVAEHSASHMGEVTPQAKSSEVKEEVQAHPKPVKLSDIGVKLSPKLKPDFTKQRNWASAQTGEALRGGQYIQGMKEDETSALNTKEFVFYSYFERVRKQLDQAWQPLLREQIQRIYKTGRKLASHSDYVTKTRITLNLKGEIVRVQLEEESGTTDLDKVAVDALNKAGPYPNPPKGLVDISGLVEIRWDFILKT